MKKIILLICITIYGILIQACKTTYPKLPQEPVRTETKGTSTDSLIKANRLLKDSIERIKGQKAIAVTIRERVCISVNGGSFTMGSSDYGATPHKAIVEDFRISETEITNAQYAIFLNEKAIGVAGLYNGEVMINTFSLHLQLVYTNGQWKSKTGFENYPVNLVTWYGADEYCKWAGGRLPTETEWEYAARGGQKNNGYLFPGSNNPQEVAWFEENSRLATHEVATKKPNELGLYDMGGNVHEWCSDWVSNPANDNTAKKTPKILRGGCWASNPYMCRVYARDFNLPENSNFNTGFRLVLPK
jgi:formylglycine-generating enzyme required for sulfatase activity